MKQKEFSLMLKLIVVLGLFFVALLALWIMPQVGQGLAASYPEFAYMYWPSLSFIWVTAVPVIGFLVLVWLIAADIGRDNSFCAENARRLRLCSILALCDCVLYIGGCAFLAVSNLLHFSIFLLICGVVAVGFAICVCCAALSHLTSNAAALKADSDLTI